MDIEFGGDESISHRELVVGRISSDSPRKLLNRDR